MTDTTPIWPEPLTEDEWTPQPKSFLARVRELDNELHPTPTRAPWSSRAIREKYGQDVSLQTPTGSDQNVSEPRAFAGTITAYAARALQEECARVTSKGPESHERNHQLFKSSASLSELIAGGELPEDLVHEELTKAALSTGLDLQEIQTTLRSGYTTGTKNPRQAPPKEQLPDVTTLGASPPAEPTKGLKLRRTTDLRLPPPTQWLGKGWLPRREITVLVGSEGIGKSLLWVLMASLITTGRPFPMFNWAARKPADVVVIVTEDSAAEVEARLKVAGADLDRVHFFCAEDDGSGTPVFSGGDGGDMLLLHGLLELLTDKPALLVVDAWLDTVAGNLNIRDTQQARAALHPWKTLATRHNLAVLLVTHTNRADTTNTRDLMGGTAALRQKARMVLFAARPPVTDTEQQHLWVGPDKANTTGIVDAVKFRVQIEQVREQTDDDPGTTAVLTSPSDALMTIGQLLGEWKREELEADRKPSKADQAEDVIREYMADQTEPVVSNDLKTHLRKAGYGKTTIEDAMRATGETAPTTKGGKWMFTLTDSKTS